MLQIKPQLAALEGINGYTPENAAAKDYFLLEGKQFLRDLAKAIGIPAGTYDIRNNKGGMAVSGEVILHADHLYVQLYESCARPGVAILFRSCDGRGDCTGNRNFDESLPLIFTSTRTREEFIARCKALGGY